MMQEQQLELPWEEPSWFAEATAWIHEQLTAHGWHSTGPVELVRLRKLLSAFVVANRLSMANRALTWHHGTGSLSQRHKAAYADSVPNWLRDFLNTETPGQNAG
jgi:hypothetical protein